MASKLISVRLKEEISQQLDAAAHTAGASRSAVLSRYVEEGLRMDAHPGVIFRPGPGGRRPALPGGPDIWEVARVLRNSAMHGDEAIANAAAWFEIPPDQVRIALDYYAHHSAEVNDWIDRVDQQAQAAEQAWKRQQGLVG